MQSYSPAIARNQLLLNGKPFPYTITSLFHFICYYFKIKIEKRVKCEVFTNDIDMRNAKLNVYTLKCNLFIQKKKRKKNEKEVKSSIVQKLNVLIKLKKVFFFIKKKCWLISKGKSKKRHFQSKVICFSKKKVLIL